MLLGGRRLLPWLLWQIAKTGSRELFTLCIIAVAVGIAYGASILFGVSIALGAFFAGLVLRESEYSHQAAKELLPFREAFAVTSIILVGKSIAAVTLVLALKYPLNTALTVSASWRLER